MLIDQPWTATDRIRSHGRCRRGERLQVGYPHGHHETTTPPSRGRLLVAGLRITGMAAPMVLDGLLNGDWFEPCVGRVLVPDLERGDVVIMDLSSHRRAGVREAIEAAGARLKSMLRGAGERTVSGPSFLVGRLVDLFHPVGMRELRRPPRR